jgi:hypothetical protein
LGDFLGDFSWSLGNFLTKTSGHPDLSPIFSFFLSPAFKAADRFGGWFESSQQICQLVWKQRTKKRLKNWALVV